MIDRHKKRIADRSDVIRFDEDSLLKEIVRSSQEQFDYMVAKGLYAPLSEEETRRLISANDEPHGTGQH